MDNVMVIAVHEAREACKGEPDILERVRKAMKACHNHWMVTNEVQQFNSALAAAMLESERDESERIGRSGKSVNRANSVLQALVSGVPVDFEALERDITSNKADDLIPVRKMWDEISRPS